MFLINVEEVIYVEELINKMDPIKRKNLINAALVEFGKNSYDKASTNVIVKEAGVSKGLLFHYFKSKKELYDYIVEFIFVKMIKDVAENIDYEKSDIIERIANISEYKMMLFKEYPGMYIFYTRIFAAKPIKELKAMINEIIPGSYDDFYSVNIDYSLFKDDIDLVKAMKITQWSLEKKSEEYLKLMQEDKQIDTSEVAEELNEYLQMFRKMFYKS